MPFRVAGWLAVRVGCCSVIDCAERERERERESFCQRGWKRPGSEAERQRDREAGNPTRAAPPGVGLNRAAINTACILLPLRTDQLLAQCARDTRQVGEVGNCSM